MTHDLKTLCDKARASATGVVVTVFPTRDKRWRMRVDVDGLRVYAPDNETLAACFTKLAEASEP
jgi:hypothetical protein